MADVTVTWRGDEVLAVVAAAVEEGMATAGKVLAASTRTRVSTPYPPASSPGNPPHARRGLNGGLQGAIDHRVVRSGRNLILLVGVSPNHPLAAQAKRLQKGTPGGQMKARPFLPEQDHAETTVVGYVEGAVRARIGR